MIGKLMFLPLFFQVLHTTRVNRDQVDCLSWGSLKKGVFRVESYFDFISGSRGNLFP